MTAHSKSRLEGGVIVPPTVLEIIVADHCNLTCRQCNHGSPAMPKWLADPAAVARDLAILGKYYRPAMLKFLGGEPLLHPDLAGLIRAAVGSGICGRVELVTNGTLLGRMTDAVWAELDFLAVSFYAAAGDYRDVLRAAAAKAAQFGVTLTVSRFDDFRETFTSVPNEDEALVRRIYGACKLANLWGVHALYRGRIYKCPQSIYVPRLAGHSGQEGMAIGDSPGFQAALLAFLNAPDPLRSCRNCLGTSGKIGAHQMLTRAHWRADLARPPADMIDRHELDRELLDPGQGSDCAVPMRLA